MLYHKIRVIFIVAIVFLSGLFLSYLYIQGSIYIQKNRDRYIQTSIFTINNFNNKNFDKFVNKMSFEKVNNNRLSYLKNHKRVVFKRKIDDFYIEIWRHKKDFYISIPLKNKIILLKDKNSISFPIEGLVLYLIFLLFLTILYFSIINSLKPLKKLQLSIEDVTNGDLSVSFLSEKNDEIGKVSNAFENALRTIEKLLHSRQLFLRMIMHELKTPIAKGKILNEFLDNNIDRDNYDMVFDRLELLIEEFSKIEQMLSSSYILKLGKYNINHIIEQSLELMILSEIEIETSITIVNIEPFVIKTDFELLSLAVKNLIDNGLKYSPHHKIEIEIYKNYIEFINIGDKVTDDLDKFIEPFNPNGNGMGLGLYIIQNISTLLELKFSYSYIDNKNRFRLGI